MNRPTAARSDWRKAWPDALAFIVGLAVAWRAGWNTTDLIWSLWLSSLVVGFAIGFWAIFSRAWGRVGDMIMGVLTFMIFAVFFGGAHWAHAGALNDFFPVPGESSLSGEYYLGVLNEYWIWLPIAFLAERSAFRLPPPRVDPVSVKAKDIDARMKRDPTMLIVMPFLRVIRMHVLILFFAFAHQKKLESFVVSAVVYAAYFFPWHLLFRPSADDVSLTRAREDKRA